MSDLDRAILATAPIVATQFDEPTTRLIAECLIRFDAMALEGFPMEMEELRLRPDAEAYAEWVLS